MSAEGPTCAPKGAAPGWAYTLGFLAFFAHNIEELAGLPGWAAAQGIAVVNRPGFANALVAVTLLAGAVLLAGRMAQFARPVQLAVAALAAALLANAASHVALSLVTASVMPGLATALVLTLPAFGFLFAKLPLGRRDKWLAGGAGVVLMPVGAAAALWLFGALA